MRVEENEVDERKEEIIDASPDLSISKDTEKLIAIYRHPFKIVNPK